LSALAQTFEMHKITAKLFVSIQPDLLSFVCPKERSKEKVRQNELLRSFCRAHAQLIELPGRTPICYGTFSPIVG